MTTSQLHKRRLHRKNTTTTIAISAITIMVLVFCLVMANELAGSLGVGGMLALLIGGCIGGALATLASSSSSKRHQWMAGDDAAHREAPQRLDEDLLCEGSPIEDVDDVLRDAGFDPDEVARRGDAFVNQLAKSRRLSLKKQDRRR